MARARNIKPSFLTNDELVELPMSHRLLFIGLWMLADREGRLEDRPRKIKMEVFPADDIDMDEALSTLVSSAFLQRYAVDDVPYIQVLNFAKHQRPHSNESPSVIPPPPTTSPKRSAENAHEIKENNKAAHHGQQDVSPRSKALGPSRVPVTDTGYLIPDTGLLELDRENGGGKPTALPPQPNPDPPIKAAPKPKPTRIPDDFSVTDPMRVWAAKAGISAEQIDYETEKFRDYYAATGKPHIDWIPTWRNWMRRSQEDRPGKPPPANGRASPRDRDIGLSDADLLARARGDPDEPSGNERNARDFADSVAPNTDHR